MAAFAGASVVSVVAAQAPSLLPGTTYDSAVPSPQAVLGYPMGERISWHAEVERYAHALAQASPRVRLVKYGESWEGRTLWLLVVGTEQNLARLEDIKTGMRALADPRSLTAAREAELLESLPAVVWLAYSVHGDEISGSDAALALAHHLAAATGDPLVDRVRERCVVVIDPLQNPDGRERFVQHFRATCGRWPDADPYAAEHNQPWPGGRSNHYLFDMNRDWFALTQPETRARVQAFLEWFPLVYVDLHEMGSNSTYYFPPPAQPINPEVSPAQLQWLEAFGRNNARWFDRMQFDWFAREEFDAFYPGYGEGWPMFHGAIGMTYEQASVRGLVMRRRDATEMHYRDSVQRHFVASLATVETASNERDGLLRSFVAFRREAVRAGERQAEAEYLLMPGKEPARAMRLAALLVEQGIEVKVAETAFRHPRVRSLLGGRGEPRELPAGTFVVPLAQPAMRLAHTLLAPHRPMSADFVKEQERRRKKRLGDQIYDLTAWSLPLLWSVECLVGEEAAVAPLRVLQAPPAPVGQAPAPATLAYLLPWGSLPATQALASLLRAGVRVHLAGKAFRLGGVDYAPGTLLVKVKDNPSDLLAQLTKVSAASGVTFVPTDTAWVESGIGFGSNEVRFVEKPRVAIAWGRPASSLSAGWARYVLEQRFGYPTTVINVDQLATAELSRYDVLVLPAGGYAKALEGAAEALKTWVRAGGTLITLGEATRWLTEDKIALLATRPEDRPNDAAPPVVKPPLVKPTAEAVADAKPEVKPEAKPEPPSAKREPFDLEKAIQPDKEPPDRVPGAIVRLDLDTEHWLAFGYDLEIAALLDSERIFTPVKLDKGRNVATYAKEDRLVLGGLVWEEVRKQIAQKAYLVWQPHGRGQVVAFAEDPNFRGLAEGLSLLFANAVFFGPAHTQRG